jgi:hypothetical protein
VTPNPSTEKEDKIDCNCNLSLRQKVDLENLRAQSTRFGLGNVVVGIVNLEQLKLDNANRPIEHRELLRERVEGNRVLLTVATDQHRSSRWFDLEKRDWALEGFKTNGITWFNNQGRQA